MGNITATSNDYEKYNLSQTGEINTQDWLIVHALALGNWTYDGYFKLNTSNAKKALQILDGQNKVRVSIGEYGSYFLTLSTSNFYANSATFKDAISLYDDKIFIGKSEYNGNNTSYIDMYNEAGNSTISMLGYSGTITAKSFNNSSLESMKKNITKFEDALEIIKNSDIYEYNFKTEKDSERKHVGFIIEDESKGKYKTSERVLSEDKKAIESYSMNSIAWRAIQQILKIVENLKQRLEVLEEK